MTTKKADKTKRAVAAKAKVTTGAKRAVREGATLLGARETEAAKKRVRVEMVKKPSPSAPTHVETTQVTPALKVEVKEMQALVVAPQPSIAKHELELMIRREAYKRAQARHFRGGTPSQDWFAAEAAVKAELHSRGVQLPN